MSGLLEHFTAVVGVEAVRNLERMASSRPCVLVSGGQLTGKTSAGQLVARQLGGRFGSTGQVFRRTAGAAGLSLEALGELHRNDPERDVRLDFEAARVVASGEVGVVESRIAGHIGRVLRGLGRAELAMVRLVCAPPELAWRAVQRHLGAELEGAFRARLHLHAGLPLDEALARIAAEPGAEALRPQIRGIVERDDKDWSRLEALYGVARDQSGAFDAVIDTSGLTAEAVAKAVLRVGQSRFSPRHLP